MSTALFTSCGQNHRSTVRPNDHSSWLPPGSRLSRKTLARQIFRFRERQKARLFDQPFFSERRKDYKCRWKIELFSKRVKQHLRIKAFFGTSKNAVKTQIWIAISIYIMVAIIKKRLDLAPSLYTILQILSVTLFEEMLS